jgi:hypothetical protein
MTESCFIKECSLATAALATSIMLPMSSTWYRLPSFIALIKRIYPFSNVGLAAIVARASASLCHIHTVSKIYSMGICTAYELHMHSPSCSGVHIIVSHRSPVAEPLVAH